jgi:hypothetical protein
MIVYRRIPAGISVLNHLGYSLKRYKITLYKEIQTRKYFWRRMTMKRTVLFLLLFAALIYPCSCAIFSKTGMEVATPNQIGYLIEDLDQTAIDLGLSKDDISAVIKQKLWQYNIQPMDPLKAEGYFYVNMNIVGSTTASYHIDIEFIRPVMYKVKGVNYTKTASMHTQAVSGIKTGVTTAEVADYIMKSLDNQMDIITEDFVHANTARMKRII